MKKWMSITLIISMACMLFTGCKSTETNGTEQTELTVFAASSMTEVLTEIGADYQAVAPDVKLVFNFDSSGTLKTQIEEGANCDIFVSAAQKQMDELQEEILPDTRKDLLENKVVLVVPEGNPAGIQSFEDMLDRLNHGDVMLAIGNEDVPVGQYTQKIFTFFGLSVEEVEATGCITYGSNAKEVNTQVQEALVDCGIVYATDAYAAGLDIVDTASADMCGQVTYPAAILKSTSQEELAKAFFEYLTSDAAAAIFERSGFTPIS